MEREARKKIIKRQEYVGGGAPFEEDRSGLVTLISQGKGV